MTAATITSPYGEVLLSDIITYREEDGLMFWKERPLEWFIKKGFREYWNKKYAGTQCMNNAVDNRGYLRGLIFQKPYRANRVAYALGHGHWPVNFVDHINGNVADNRFCNLRDVSNAENGKNQKKSVCNKSGVTGVFFASRSARWMVSVGGRSHGSFKDFNDAVAARRALEVQHSYHENHGKSENERMGRCLR